MTGTDFAGRLRALPRSGTGKGEAQAEDQTRATNYSEGRNDDSKESVGNSCADCDAGARGSRCCGTVLRRLCGDGHVAVNELVSAVNRALGGCSDDGICDASSCSGQLAECRDDLADCRAQPGGHAFPATGQTTAYGTDSDGDVQAGATLSYSDNGDGTITDNNTGLMWEKKDDSGGIHDKDNSYFWWGGVSGGYLMNGTMVTVFLATLNSKPLYFAGHCDWRIPNKKELESIVDEEQYGPAVSAAFNNGCELGCTVTACSCTASDHYWSSTTQASNPRNAWIVDFSDGSMWQVYKDDNTYVRAVRGGL
jgi:hypothetical protein